MRAHPSSSAPPDSLFTSPDSLFTSPGSDFFATPTRVARPLLGRIQMPNSRDPWDEDIRIADVRVATDDELVGINRLPSAPSPETIDNRMTTRWNPRSLSQAPISTFPPPRNPDRSVVQGMPLPAPPLDRVAMAVNEAADDVLTAMQRMFSALIDEQKKTRESLMLMAHHHRQETWRRILLCSVIGASLGIILMVIFLRWW